MKTLILFLLLIICPLVVQAQSDTCTDGQSLVIDTVNKRYKCLTISAGGLGAGGNINMTVANASSTGTTVNKLAKLTGAPSTAVIAATSDTENAVGIVVSGAGTTGSATIAIMGQASCVFDGATTAGNYFTISSTVAGDCHDAGSSFPTSAAAYGRVLSTNGAGGTFTVELMTPDVAFQNAGNGKSKPGTPTEFFQYNSSSQFTSGPLAVVDAGTPIVRRTAGSGVGSSQQFFVAREYTNTSNFHGLRLGCSSGSCDVAISDQGLSLASIDMNIGVGSGSSVFLYSGGALRWQFDSSGHFVPTGSDGGFNVGSTGKHVGSLYVNKILTLGNGAIYSSGTPSIAGNGTLNTNSKDSAGKVTATGTGASTIVLTFSAAFTNAPACMVTNETTSNLVRPVSTTTTLTIAATIVTGDSLSYTCLGY